MHAYFSTAKRFGDRSTLLIFCRRGRARRGAAGARHQARKDVENCADVAQELARLPHSLSARVSYERKLALKSNQ